MINSLRNIFRSNLFLRKLVGYYAASSGLFDSIFKNYKLSGVLLNRANKVLASSDNAFIPRVPDAGAIKGGKQIMHNGLKIHLGSYYGPEYSQLLLLNKGVHEPQEERVFAQVLPSLPAGSVMIEMGAFWSFYSMWFQKEVPQGISYMIEPDSFNIGQGQRNFHLNGFKGTFVQAFIGEKNNRAGKIPTIAIDDFVAENKIPFIHLLHSDIQGFENQMLRGAEASFRDNKIGYVFISTHSNEVHNECRQFLLEKEMIILADANIDQSYSEDGLIVARSPHFKGIDPVNISLKQ